MDKIRPYIIKIDSPEKFQESREAQFGVSPGDRWAAEYGVILGDKNILDEYEALHPLRKFHVRHTLNKFTNRTNGSLGVTFFFLVCSPSYARNPDSAHHNSDDTKKAFVQDSFNEKEALAYLKGRIGQIGEIDPANLSKVLVKFLNTTEWDEE